MVSRVLARRDFLKQAGPATALLAATGACSVLRTTPSPRRQKPNFVVILADDLGYGDVGVYGAKGLETPNLDGMAAGGVRFTDFYAAASICSPTRAALLTGCYPQRVGIPAVLGPQSQIGINAEETLLSEALRAQGYRTAIIGKWHLGHHEPFLPLRHGFDEWFGTPGSNDHPYTNNDPRKGALGRGPMLYENNTIVETDPDQRRLTSRYTERAIQFIEQNKDRPFFLYVAHNMPHTPLAVGERFAGKSRRGIYGDVIAELDWSVGEILKALQRNGIDRQTLVLFTSDNGPWLIFGDHGGSAGPLRGGKKQLTEGGVRVPFIARWPGMIPAGSIHHEPAAIMDFYPTIVNLAGGTLPERRIDGFDILPLLTGQTTAQLPRETFYYYWHRELHAVRWRKWKLQLPHVDRQAPKLDRIGMGGQRGEVMNLKCPLALFDLENDVGETTDVAAQHGDVVELLFAVAEEARADLGDTLTDRPGGNVRSPGRLS